MKQIITIQHTQSEQHTNGMMGGWTDWPLTEQGIYEADNIGKALAKEIDASQFVMVCSDLQRAQQTAAGVNQHLGLTPILRPELRELNVGVDTPVTRDWFRANALPCTPHPTDADSDAFDLDYRAFDHAESNRDLWNRLLPFRDELLASQEKNIIVVSHGLALSTFFALWLSDDVNFLRTGGLWGLAGGVSWLCVHPDGKRTIKTLNDMGYKRGYL